jgi:hypothetical protein
MYKVLCFLACFVTVLLCQAQQAGVIQVIVYNHQQLPLTPATLQLHRLPDSSLVKVVVTGAEGKATFESIQPGTYFLQVSFLGYLEHTTPGFPFTGQKLLLPPLSLQPTSGEMKGVTVVAKKPFVELKPGKTVVNVEAGITNAGTTMMEALEKMPGITVDKDGNISLKGRAGVLVIIDGKQTYLDPAQLSTLLNGMSASQVSEVEITDQPPASYDAAGNAGIIHIKTKKSRQKGFNGSVTTAYSQGVYPKSNNNLLLNYRTGKWNFFSSYSLNASRNFTRIYALRTYFGNAGGPVSLLEQPSLLKSRGYTHNLRAGADYALSNKTSLGITFSGLALSRRGVNTNEASWMNRQGITDSLLRTTGNNSNNWKNGGAGLNFRHSFTANRELTADVDVISYRMRVNQFFENRLLFPGTYIEEIRAYIPSALDIKSAKADYTEQIKNIRLQTGMKASRITTDNNADYQTRDGGPWEADYNRSNHFLYTENIQAVYANAETKRNRWSLQAGLRLEATSYDARQLGNPAQKDSSFSRSYSSIFPSLSTSFEADSSNSFSLSAGRRIDRPAFQKLNPFISIINKYTVQRGNPFFRPQYTWNMEARHVYKNRLITGIGYSITRDYFSQIFPVDVNGLVVYTEGNLDKLQQFTVSVGTQLSPVPWWSSTSQAVFVHKVMQGFVAKQLNAKISQLTVNVNNQFRLNGGFSAELSGTYTSRSQEDIQEILDPSGQLSVGLAKTVWQGRGTLKLAVRDIFYTQWIKGDTYFPRAYEYFKLTHDSRVGQLSFTYRFGKTVKASSRSEGSAGEEIRRAGNE